MAKVWVVWFDGEPEYASGDYYDAFDRYAQLRKGFGEDRVMLKMEEGVK